MAPTNSLDSLPPEILLLIFHHVATLATPQTLLHLTSVCRTFHTLLVPPHLATDKTVWRTAIHAFLGAASPHTLHDPTYQSFFRRMLHLHAPPPPNPSTTSFRRLKPTDHLFTSSHGPSPLKTSQKLLRLSQKSSSHPPHPVHKINTCPLPPLLPHTRRDYDFLHTCTEASRPLEGFCYMSTAPHTPTFVFAEDPRVSPFYHSHPFLFTRGTLTSGPGYPLTPLPPAATPSDFESNTHYLLWAQQSLHSDPDLLLHPGNDYKEILSVTNVSNGHTWTLPSLLPLPLDETIYEFRSAGEYLALCSDPGAHPETPPLLTCIHTSGAHWTKPLGPTHSAWIHENDGLKMTSSVIAIASRRSHNMASTRPHMKIFLYSTCTGALIRTLHVPQETRLGETADLWCSFAVSDTHIFATVGGHHEDPELGKRWQYLDLLIWELRDGGSKSPCYAAGLPGTWRENEDTYVCVSRDGRRAVVAGGWSCVVYDVVKKTCEGVWNVPDGKRVYDVLDRRDMVRPHRVRDFSFNGMWVGYKDVGDDGKTVARGVGFFTGDVFREFNAGEGFERDPDGGEGEGRPVWSVREGVWECDVEGVERPYHKNLLRSFLRPRDEGGEMGVLGVGSLDSGEDDDGDSEWEDETDSQGTDWENE